MTLEQLNVYFSLLARSAVIGSLIFVGLHNPKATAFRCRKT